MKHCFNHVRKDGIIKYCVFILFYGFLGTFSLETNVNKTSKIVLKIEILLPCTGLNHLFMILSHFLCFLKNDSK